MSQPDLSWQNHAACRNDPLDGWYQKQAGVWITTRTVRKCFEECPVQEQCLVHATTLPEVHGMWGGFSEAELFAIRTRRYGRCRECGRRWPKARLTGQPTCRRCLMEELDRRDAAGRLDEPTGDNHVSTHV